MYLPKFIFPKKDFKLDGWSGSLCNIIYPEKYKYVEFFFIILKSSLIRLTKKRKDIVFYRYLNANRSLAGELLILITDLFIFFICFLGLVEIRWIIHNIDYETIDKFPVFTKIKRWSLLKISKKKYITDEILLPIAIEKMKNKYFIPISFGKPIIEYTTDKLILKKIKFYKNQDKNLFIGVASCWVKKSEGVHDLIIQTLKFKKNIMIFYLGEEFKFEHERLIKFHTKLSFSIDDFDFCLKSLSDLSIPSTIYECAHFKKPIIYDNKSIFGIIAEKYNIGCSIDKINKYNFDPISNCCKEDFFKNRNWKTARNKIFTLE